jgi:hypothetical protein
MIPNPIGALIRARSSISACNAYRAFAGIAVLTATFSLSAAPARAAGNEGAFRWVLQDLSRFPDPEVIAMVSDDQGNKWFAGKKGLTRLSQLGDWQNFTAENTAKGLVSNAITALAIGENRELWVATEGGVSWYANGAWKSFTKENTGGGLPDNFVTSLAIGREERWFGTKSGFAMLRASAWTTYGADRISGRLPNKIVTSIALDSSGDKWIGTIAGLVRFSGSTWTPYTRDNTNGGLPHNSITWLTVAPNGVKWVGTQMGTARLSVNVWTSFKGLIDLGELASEQVYSLTMEKSGTLWVAAKGGAARYDGTSWTLFNKNNTSGIQTRFVYSVMAGKDGDVWFGTQKGVVAMLPVPKDE